MYVYVSTLTHINFWNNQGETAKRTAALNSDPTMTTHFELRTAKYCAPFLHLYYEPNRPRIC